MNSKRFLALIWILIAYCGAAQAQNTFSFAMTSDTAIEANTVAIAGYIKADAAPLADDSVQVILLSGSPRPSHMSTQSIYTIYFPAGADSVPFSVQLYDDTFPENPEHVHYQLNAYGTADSIGANSTMVFVLKDNDLPATISFVIDTGSAYLSDGTFSVCVTINNPNPFYVRYYTRTYDSAFVTPLGHFSALGGWNYFYDWGTVWAPPGISTQCQDIRIVADTAVLPDKTLLVVIQNLDDNILIDSTFTFTIRNDNTYYPPSVSFDLDSMLIQKDTALIIGIPITTVNPNHRAFSFIVDTIDFSSTSSFDSATLYHIYLNNTYFSHPGGIWHDTMRVNILNNHLIEDTSHITFRIKGVRLNTAMDTLFHLTLIDTGSLILSFKGAGFAHLKMDSIGYVQVYTSAPVKYDITADVTYLNGDAVRGTDFLWNDTTVTFPANAFDTISLPVTMLRNGLHDGNKQINFLLSNANTTNVRYDIIQYTYMIIDNDSTAVWTSIQETDDQSAMRIYPNPFTGVIHLHTDEPAYNVVVTDMVGRELKKIDGLSGDATITLQELPAGNYIIQMKGERSTAVQYLTKM